MQDTSSSEPLSFVVDLGSVDTSRPCPVAGNYVARFVKPEVKMSSKGQGQNLFLHFALESSANAVPDSTGTVRTINPGFQITECCVMWQGENPNQPDWRLKLAKVYDALMGTNDATRPSALNWLECVGRTCVLTLKPEEDGEYGLRPQIKKFAVHRV